MDFKGKHLELISASLVHCSIFEAHEYSSLWCGKYSQCFQKGSSGFMEGCFSADPYKMVPYIINIMREEKLPTMAILILEVVFIPAAFLFVKSKL